MEKAVAFIYPAEVALSVRLHWQNRFKAYTKIGPVTLGDNKVPVLEGETSIEIFEPELIKQFESFFPEARKVEVIWKQ